MQTQLSINLQVLRATLFLLCLFLPSRVYWNLSCGIVLAIEYIPFHEVQNQFNRTQDYKGLYRQTSTKKKSSCSRKLQNKKGGEGFPFCCLVILNLVKMGSHISHSCNPIQQYHFGKAHVTFMSVNKLFAGFK